MQQFCYSRLLRESRLPVYDADLHWRFIRSASDAMFQCAELSLAATKVWQDQAALACNPNAKLAQSPAPMPTDPIAAWAWAFDAWRSPAKSQYAPQYSPILPFQPTGTSLAPNAMMAAMNPWAFLMGSINSTTRPATNMFSPPFGLPLPNPFLNQIFGTQAPALGPEAWLGMVRAFWSSPAMSWTMYQSPMAAMMVSAGMPYAMALPAARASTSALDAAEAARQQALKVFSAYRSDGGHASTQVIEWPFPTNIIMGDGTRRNTRH